MQLSDKEIDALQWKRLKTREDAIEEYVARDDGEDDVMEDLPYGRK